MPRKNKAAAAETEPAEVFTSPQSHTVEGGSFVRSTGEVVIGFRDKKKDGAPTVYYTGTIRSEDWDGLVAAEHKQSFMTQVINKKYKLTRCG